MCGICGVIHINGALPVTRSILKKMTDVMAHRGPDGEGFFSDQFVGFGHRRLAIIDLSSAGHQPMLAGENDRYVLVFNGEIYNFKDLRSQLQQVGHQFFSQTDSEVVLRSYMEWGKDCVTKFNGMFAFAVWDKLKQRLFIARDRYGIKPLYYAQASHYLIFASEQKAILQHPEIRRCIDVEGLLEYFTFQNFFTDKTLLKGIKLFPPAHYGTIQIHSFSNLTTPKLKFYSYWDYNFREPDVPCDEVEYIEELDRLFNQAVESQLVSDVELGTFLSGGMDSGAITAISARKLPYIKTFTCGFDLSSASGLELGYDERILSEYMSYLFKTEHYEMVLKAGDMERILPKLSWHLEEPRVGQSYPNFYVSQLASKFVKVVLSGSGGDELFGGYPWRYYRAVVNNSFEDYINKYYLFWQRLIPNKDIKKIFTPIWGQCGHVWTKDIFKDVFKSHCNEYKKPEDYVNSSLYFEAKTFLHGLLIVEDKLSMAHGLESRVPFLDNRLVDFAMQIPTRLKLGNLENVIRLDENEPGKLKKYYNKTKDGKLILRKAMAKYIPSEISTGVKQGFSAPDASWFKGESIEYVKYRLFDSKALIYDYMDKKAVLSLVNEHLSGKKNRRLLIWSLLNFEWWLKNYLSA